uniref:EF-hand domain-containing protein n=1 Tax=Palpitomonas bilix TaxID=652834 RepID=A0A7S3GLY2_9EUKA
MTLSAFQRLDIADFSGSLGFVWSTHAEKAADTFPLVDARNRELCLLAFAGPEWCCFQWHLIVAIELLINSVFLAYILLRLFHLGIREFVKKAWNVATVLLIVSSFVGLLVSISTTNRTPNTSLTAATIAENPYIFNYTKIMCPLIVVAFSQKLRHALTVFFRTLPSIFNALFSLIILLLVFGLFGIMMFGELPPYTTSCEFCSFNTTTSSLLGLYVLITTENYPEIMNAAFAYSPVFSVFFFMVFLVIGLYFLLNVVIASFIDAYRTERKKQVLKLRIRERKSLLAAFQVLDSDNKGFISQETFSSLMKEVLPKAEPAIVNMLFELMDADGNNQIDVFEFFEMLDTLLLRFRVDKSPVSMQRTKRIFKKLVAFIFCKTCRKGEPADSYPKAMVQFQAFCTSLFNEPKRKVIFSTVTSVVSILNAAVFVLIAEKYADNLTGTKSFLRTDLLLLADFSIAFVMVFEMLLKYVGHGTEKFVEDKWNLFDLCCVLVSFGASIYAVSQMTVEINPFQELDVNVFRSFRILRFFTVTKEVRLFSTLILDMFRSLYPYFFILLALTYFFVFFGCLFFVDESVTLPPWFSFSAFSLGTVTMAQEFTMSNWHTVMYAYMNKKRTRWETYSTMIFFVAFNLVVSIISVNLVSAVVIEVYEVRRELAGQENDILLEAANNVRSRDEDDEYSNSAGSHDGNSEIESVRNSKTESAEDQAKKSNSRS